MRIALAVPAVFTIVASLAICAPSLMAQDNGFQPRFNSFDRDAREGYCKLRVRVDKETDVVMAGDRVILHDIQGHPSYDVGSECSSPLPRGGIVDFDFRQTDGPGRARVVDAPDRGNGRVVIHVYDPADGDHKYTLEFRWRAVHRDGWGDWDGDGRGVAPPPPPPMSYRMDDAIAECRSIIRDQIWNRYRAREPDFFRVRADEGRRDWIVGDAVARRHDDRLELRFECNADRSGRIVSARVWERDRDDRR